MRRSLRIIAAAALALAIGVPLEAAQKSKTAAKKKTTAPSSQVARSRTAQSAYDRTLARERTLRASRRKAPLSQMRAVITEYEAIARRWPRSGYADNALWNGANLAYDANISYGAKQERDTAMAMLRWLVKEYPSSSLTRDAQTRLRKISAAAPKTTKADTATRSARAEPAAPPPAATELAKANIRTAEAEPSAPDDATVDEAPSSTPPPATAPDARSTTAPAAAAAARASDAPGKVVVRDIKRVVLPEVVRVTIELDGEVAYHEETLQNPARLFFDLRGTSLAPSIDEGAQSFADGDIVREVRVGTHPGSVTRVVLDTEGVARHSLFTLYNPYRLVLDMYRDPALMTQRPAAAGRTASRAPEASKAAGTGSTPAAMPPAEAPAAAAGSTSATSARATSKPPPSATNADATLPSTPAGPNVATAPTAPESNSSGSYSLARQLGLGVSRIVIDPGHGGHDPGSLGDGIREA